jgi:hypothetical protein
MAAAAAAADQQQGRIDKDKEKDLLSSVVGDIRCYSGSDPLRPWLRYGPAPRSQSPRRPERRASLPLL